MNKEKFKELSFKQKLQWLVQYYGVVALISIIAILVVFNLVKSILFPDAGPDVCIMILSDEVYTEEAIEMQYNLSKDLECVVDVSAYMISDPYGMQSFATRIMTDQVDIVVAPKDASDDMKNNSYITEYEELNNTDICISVPVKGRESEAQKKSIEYLRKRFSK